MTNELCLKLGFPPLTDVATFKSIAHLFASGRKGSRCGLYLLELSDGCFYIGQSVEVVRRFAQHCKNHEIVAFAFIRVKAGALNDAEFNKIRQAEELGLRLRNVIHTTIVDGETDLDLIISEKEQRAWVCDAKRSFKKDTSERIQFPQSHLDRYAERFRRFERHQQSELAQRLLRTYLINCIVAPVRTEYSFWNVSCMPSSGGSKFPRMFCVSAASMELFVLMSDSSDPSFVHGFVNVSLNTIDNFFTEDEFTNQHPGVEIYIRDYRDAGEDQITLHAYGAESLERLLNDERVQLAAGILSQRVMRKRPTFYAQYHCAQLAERALAPNKPRNAKKAATRRTRTSNVPCAAQWPFPVAR